MNRYSSFQVHHEPVLIVLGAPRGGIHRSRCTQRWYSSFQVHHEPVLIVLGAPRGGIHRSRCTMSRYSTSPFTVQYFTVELVQIERPTALNLINTAHGHSLCTLHRAEGLYSWVRRRGYMRDSLPLPKLIRYTPATQAGLQTRGPLYLTHMVWSVDERAAPSYSYGVVCRREGRSILLIWCGRLTRGPLYLLGTMK